ncbi:MAG: small multidrug export protein [Ruminococcaceae bacterium]|nr:small multidrug export protein [Oscillospiraceae bacterium]
MGFLWNTFIGKIILTVLVSMVPIIELRGALPIATGAGLEWYIALPVALIGNIIPVPFIIIFIKKIFAWMSKQKGFLAKIVIKMEEKAFSKKDTIEKYGPWGLWIFVAIPLPGTGAWTGALIAAMMGISLKKSFPAIATGVLTAGIIVAFVSYGAAALLF